MIELVYEPNPEHVFQMHPDITKLSSVIRDMAQFSGEETVRIPVSQFGSDVLRAFAEYCQGVLSAQPISPESAQSCVSMTAWEETFRENHIGDVNKAVEITRIGDFYDVTSLRLLGAKAVARFLSVCQTPTQVRELLNAPTPDPGEFQEPSVWPEPE